MAKGGIQALRNERAMGVDEDEVVEREDPTEAPSFLNEDEMRDIGKKEIERIKGDVDVTIPKPPVM